MGRADLEAQKVIDTFGVELIRDLLGKPEATAEEIRQLVKQAVANWKRRTGITVAIKPYNNEEERLESILDWLNRPSSQKGGRNAGNK